MNIRKAFLSADRKGVTLVHTQPTDPAAGNTVAHAPVSKWDYAFMYGDASIKCTALTRFNDCTIRQAEGFSAAPDGLHINTGRVLMENIVSGGNLDADCDGTEFYGISVVNGAAKTLLAINAADKNSVSVWLGGSSFAVLAGEDKTIKTARCEELDGICAVVIPENFTGSILIPVSSIITKGEKWAPAPLESLGFYAQGDILLTAMFICDTHLELPGDKTSSIDNPLYSYTDKQRMLPFWKHSTMYNESMAMMQQENGEILGKLLFVPQHINAVVDVYLKKEYKEGIDWVWEKGTNIIRRTPGSSIPFFTENDLSGRDENGQFIPEFPTWTDGKSRFGACIYCISPFIFEKQICVSYTYDLAQVKERNIKSTVCQKERLPLTTKALKEGRDIRVLFYGDSIFSGCDASSMYNREPYMPYMHKLIQDGLNAMTSGKVTVDNIAVGGWTVENGLDALSGPVGDYNYSGSYSGYDLMILSFGMNNGNTPMEEFSAKTQAIIDTVKKANPHLETVLVSCMNPNPRVGWDNMQKYQGAALRELADLPQNRDNCALVDFYAVHKSILQYKTFASTTGNNINHPNDWLIRVYAQNILEAIAEQ